MATWTCETCKITIQSVSKYKHMKTKKHLKNQLGQPVEDCSICMEPMISSKKCRACKQMWCTTCDQNIATCPYCRVNVAGRQVQAREQRINNYNWYASSEAFEPENEVIHNDFIHVLEQFANWFDQYRIR